VRALSLWQPWATLLAAGVKRVETRDWLTNHVGALAIHATASVPQPYRDDAEALVLHSPPFRDPLRRLGVSTLEGLPHGAIVGLVRVTTEHHVGAMTRDAIAAAYGPNELALGNYAAGRVAIHTDAAVLLPYPIPCRGDRRLWHVPDAVAVRILEQMKSHPMFPQYRDAFDGVTLTPPAPASHTEPAPVP
jgi:hypothetical protein